MKGREELFSFKIPAPSGPGAKIGRPRPSTTATPRKLPLHSHSAFKPFAHYSDRLLVRGPRRAGGGAGGCVECAAGITSDTRARLVKGTYEVSQLQAH